MNIIKKNSIILLIFMVFILNSGCRPSSGRVKVGVYYYPWYRTHAESMNEFGYRSKWNRAMRTHLKPIQEPALGHYASKDPDVIEAHIDQSIRGNINFWAISWWGTNNYTDRMFKHHILTHKRAGDLKYALLYETTRKFGDFNDPDHSKLIDDLKYMARNYFTNNLYLKINNRPVVFIYLTREYFQCHGEKTLVK